VDINKDSGLPGVELVLTTLHSGGKYGQGGYKFSGGTHGVGAKCVNAVSEWFEVECHAMSRCSHGVRARQDDEEARVIGKSKKTGTLITFLPDKEIFRETVEFKTTSSRSVCVTGVFEFGLEIVFADERQTTAEPETFYYKNGVEEFVKQLNKSKEPLHPKPSRFARRRRKNSTTRTSKFTSRSCCNTTTAITTRCFATRTRFTIPTAARISPASAARSLAPSINTRSRTNC